MFVRFHAGNHHRRLSSGWMQDGYRPLPLLLMSLVWRQNPFVPYSKTVQSTPQSFLTSRYRPVRVWSCLDCQEHICAAAAAAARHLHSSRRAVVKFKNMCRFELYLHGQRSGSNAATYTRECLFCFPRQARGHISDRLADNQSLHDEDTAAPVVPCTPKQPVPPTPTNTYTHDPRSIQ